MQQSNAIFGSIVIAYLIFITGKGELGGYITLLRGGGQQPQAAADGSSSGGIFGDVIGKLKSGVDNLIGDSNANMLFNGVAGGNGNLPSADGVNFIPGTPFYDTGNPLPNPANYK